jgi:hypothetical protein
MGCHFFANRRTTDRRWRPPSLPPPHRTRNCGWLPVLPIRFRGSEGRSSHQLGLFRGGLLFSDFGCCKRCLAPINFRLKDGCADPGEKQMSLRLCFGQTRLSHQAKGTQMRATGYSHGSGRYGLRSENSESLRTLFQCAPELPELSLRILDAARSSHRLYSWKKNPPRAQISVTTL